MNNDFVIFIDNKESIKSYNLNINNNNLYYYWCDKDILEKISLNNNNNKYHISCFFGEKTNFNNLVNKYILLFLKNPKILFGIIKVKSIIIKNIPEKNYLEDDEDEKEKYNKKSIIINEEIYNELLKKYKTIEIPKMFFIEFDYLYQFKYEIDIKKFNEYNLINNKNVCDFKYPKKVQNKQIIKGYDDNFKTNILNYIEFINIQDNLHSNNNNIINSNIINSNIKLNKIIQFNIPVLWNGCKDIKNMFINLKNNINKKVLLNHYTNCKKCEINDNNNKLINLYEKKIVIKNINDENNFNIFNNLINNYTNIEKFLSNNENNFEFEKDKINIICCNKSKNIYNNCLFILE
jgi:hypothetical protein